MVGCFALAWLTGDSEEWRLVHVFAGGALVGAALFRVAWGLIGSRYARFADFLQGPRQALAYLKSLLGPRPEHYVGHNPAGGYAIVLLLGFGLVSGASGWLAYQEMGGEWLAELHELAVHAMLVVVLVHLGGVFIGSIAHRENLVRPMVTGFKSGDAADRIAGTRPVAALTLLAWASAVSWWLSR
ncbi:MAG: cytochrome b/b6 domain-containing protein [Rhodocyclales bacterium]|nr:cytochrome b/b6 domain-containing protein [Rhodocyclales bacterium]